MPETNNQRSWELLLERLKNIEDQQTASLHKQEMIVDCISSLKVDVALLKIKAGIWGLIGGAIPVCTALLIWLLRTI